MESTNKSIKPKPNEVCTKKTRRESLPNHEIDGSCESGERNLHKSCMRSWSEEIAKNGFAHCTSATCNFTSSDVSALLTHSKSCSVTSINGRGTSREFGSMLASIEDLSGCSAGSTGMGKPNQKVVDGAQSSSNSTVEDSMFKKWEQEIKNFGQITCKNQKCNFGAMNVPDIENHLKVCTGAPNFSLFCCVYCRRGFLTKDDHLKHQKNCKEPTKLSPNSKKVENLHFRAIKQMKDNNCNEDHIIQPGPELPEGQYRRRRAYRAEHKNSWALTLEKFKYVKCIYQNCYFIAMSLEDMISHFGYCNGDGSFAKHVCPYCNGRVTSEAVLLKHIEWSHTPENSSVKVEPLVDRQGEDLADSNRESWVAESCENGKTPEASDISDRRKSWQEQIDEFGYAFCQKSLCNFMAPSTKVLEVHLRSCDGIPDFDLLNCPKCRYRLPTAEVFADHVPFCKNKRIQYFSSFRSDITDSQHERIEENEFEIRPVFSQYQGKRAKTNPKPHKTNSTSGIDSLKSEPVSNEKNMDILNSTNTSKPKRGRPKKKVENTDTFPKGRFKCAKCDFQGTKTGFVYHNLKTHTGLAWIEGEEPVDMNNEKLVIQLVKEAFKINKKAACEKCDDVKRSVMGFVSHIQNCGKSDVEKDALKAQCPHCDGKYLKYSLGTHIKLYHSESLIKEGEEDKEKNNVVEEPSGKRRSAIKAVSRFQQALDENEETETNREHYILYEKGTERLPKLNSKLNNLWYKLKRENRKICCRHFNCTHLSDDVKEAKIHHFVCPFLPEKVFMCESCDFYSADESIIKSHVPSHRKYSKQKKILDEEEIKMDGDVNENDEDEDEDDEEEEEEEEGKSTEDEDVFDEPRKRKKKGHDKMRKKTKVSAEPVKADLDIELRLRQNFCKREKLENVRGTNFYSNGLELTLQEELSALENADTWPEFHTTLQDWSLVPPEQALRCFPELTKSVSVRFSNNESEWRRFKRFAGDVLEGVPVMFTGGTVRCISWCKISYKKMMEKTQRQYLAVTTAKKFDHLKDIYDRSSVEKSALLQIWDCGTLDNDLIKDAPSFSLGIVQKGGEIWDMTWFPEDTSAEAAGKWLTRLGLLATASEDGVVRVWSVCHPKQLENKEGLPVYTTEPIAVLLSGTDVDESCFQLSVGPNGVLAGGFGNGTVAIWSLRNISSPFTKTSGKSKIIRAHLVFQAHRAAITALALCPLNSRYISTAGLDRFVKVWDLEFPSVPVEQYNKEYSLDNIWMMNWPSLIYNFDDIVTNSNKGAVKFIKDILSERHHCTFAMEDSCSSLSFSNWLNALCGGSVTGEVKLRFLKNLISDQKRSQSTISAIRLEKLTDNKSRENKSDTRAADDPDKDRLFPRSYNEIDSGFGLVFKDNLGTDKGKQAKRKAHPEEFPIRAVNKVAFNPNFICFTHIALGYNCGLIRIIPVKELQSSRSLKYFLDKFQKKNS